MSWKLKKKAQALAREAQDLAGVPLDDPKTTKAAAKIWHKQVELVQELKTRFDALGPPPDGEETTVGDFRSDIAHALTLGKQYTQDEALNWGFLTQPESRHYLQPRRHEEHEAE